MSNNKIVSLSFDKKFFLSPHYKGFISREFTAPASLRDTIIVSGDEMLRKYDDEFVSMLNDDEIGSCPLLPDGNYNIKVSYNPQKGITFSFFNIDTNTNEAETEFDPEAYLSDYSKLFIAWAVTKTKSTREQGSGKLEHDFSINYFKKTFKQLLQGNPEFWQRFHRDFDTATAPMNAHFDRIIHGKPPKKVHHLLHSEYLELKNKMG